MEGIASKVPFTLVIIATDSGSPPKSTQITLNLFVDRAAAGIKGAPRFIHPSSNDYVVTILEVSSLFVFMQVDIVIYVISTAKEVEPITWS